MAQDVFQCVEEKRASEHVEAIVKVTYMELYREELRDLLDVHPNQKELHIREDKKGNTGNMTKLQSYFLQKLTVGTLNTSGHAVRISPFSFLIPNLPPFDILLLLDFFFIYLYTFLNTYNLDVTFVLSSCST